MKYFICYAIRKYSYKEEYNHLYNVFLKLDEEITSMKQINLIKDRICEQHHCSRNSVAIISFQLV